MTVVAGASWEEQLGLQQRKPPEFFRTLQEIEDHAPALQAHAMSRAWIELGLSGILCLDRQPTVYLKEVVEIDPEQMRELHQRHWNQGLAPILLVVSPEQIHIYSSLALPARHGEPVNTDRRLIDVLDRVAQALEIRQLTATVETGVFFRQYGRSFDPRLRVDHYLLNNLDAARRLLEEADDGALDTQIVLALLGRTVFTCYLIDRDIIGSEYLADVGATGATKLREILAVEDPQEANRLLYRLFTKLKIDFNGDLFQGNLEAESQQVRPEHIDVLRRFLRGDRLEDGQPSLGFWAYDFSIIPIETISAIYESFLDAESPSEKRKIGAYYTPRFVAELVLDTALDGWTSLLDKRFLDPACGSGIFLVGLFNRLAVEWRRQNRDASNEERTRALAQILRRQIFGVDTSETACRIAAFSLYLALLDQLEPRDIQNLQRGGSWLPKLVLERGETSTGGRSILCRDFFEEELPFPEDDFDLVIGNPPWAEARMGLMVEWCRKHGKRPIAQNQLAYGFLWKAPTHLREHGRVCFLIPASILLNQQRRAQAFQEAWLQEFQTDRVINLGDMSLFLFENAQRPAIILRYSNEKPTSSCTSIDYLTPKTDLETLRVEILRLSAEDQKSIKLREVLFDLQNGDPPRAWKQALWGTPRDRRFLDRLDEYSRLSGLTSAEGGGASRWIIGEGFNTLGKGRPVERPILREIPFLPVTGLETYVIPTSALRPEPRTYAPHYLGKEEIFRAPHVLFPHGVSRNGGRIKAGFSSSDSSFEHSVRAIGGPAEDEDLLRFLACVLASPLALYYFFHNSANWGAERAKLHVVEYQGFPFPLPNGPDRRALVDEAARRHRQLQAQVEAGDLLWQSTIAQYQAEFDHVVYLYYDIDLWEEILIRDTVDVWIPSATPTRGKARIPTIEVPKVEERQAYASLLCRVLNDWGQGGPYCFNAGIIVSTQVGAGAIVLSRERGGPGGRVDPEADSSAELDRVLDRIWKVLPRREGSFSYYRDLKVFVEDRLYLFKPLQRRFWTQTNALNDADEIARAILSARRREP
jgi:N-6 DNA Methylase